MNMMMILKKAPWEIEESFASDTSSGTEINTTSRGQSGTLSSVRLFTTVCRACYHY